MGFALPDGSFGLCHLYGRYSGALFSYKIIACVSEKFYDVNGSFAVEASIGVWIHDSDVVSAGRDIDTAAFIHIDDIGGIISGICIGWDFVFGIVVPVLLFSADGVLVLWGPILSV